MTRLSESGELGLLAELERRGLIVGVEHDAALLGADLVVTQDALVEGVHFRLDWIGWRELGFRAAAVNVSDLAASGAVPEALLVTLALPASTETASVIELYEGIAEAGVPVVGGDTTSAPAALISVTALGRSERVPGRAGAVPGDVLVVTGPARRCGSGVPRRLVRAPAAAHRRRAGTRAPRACPPRRLGRARRRRRAHCAAVGCPDRDRARRRAARARRDRRRPRLRRGLRAAGRRRRLAAAYR